MVPPKEMERLVQYYKGKLTENALLNKAARLAAKRDLLLKSKLPAGIIKAKVKPLSREWHHLTKRVRCGPIGGMGGQFEEDDDDYNALVMGPMEQVIKKIMKGTPARKSVKKKKNDAVSCYHCCCYWQEKNLRLVHTEKNFLSKLLSCDKE